MATATVTEYRSKKWTPKNVKLPPENERFMRACADIASALIQDHEAQQHPNDETVNADDANGDHQISHRPKRDLNLNTLRGKIARKYQLSTQPPLTAIIAAVPEHYKKYILPKLIAKPIRMVATLHVLLPIYCTR